MQSITLCTLQFLAIALIGVVVFVATFAAFGRFLALSSAVAIPVAFKALADLTLRRIYLCSFYQAVDDEAI